MESAGRICPVPVNYLQQAAWGEASKILVSSFTDRPNWKDNQIDLIQKGLQPLEKKLCERYWKYKCIQRILRLSSGGKNMLQNIIFTTKDKLCIFKPVCFMTEQKTIMHGHYILDRIYYISNTMITSICIVPRGTFKVARWGFWVTIPLHFKPLAHYWKQSQSKATVTAVLVKDESLRWGKFYGHRGYHSNVVTPSPFLF